MKAIVKKYSLYILGFIAGAIYLAISTGYNPFVGSGDKGVVVTPEQFANFKKDKSNDGKRVALIGRAEANGDITYILGRPIRLPFVDADKNLIEFFEFELKENGKNCCYIPTEFKSEDLVLYDNEGKAHAYDEQVVVSFTMERITEAIPEQNPETGEYAWHYKQLRIDPVK